MGYAKQLLLEQEMRGWFLVDNKYVCGACVDDPYVTTFIDERAIRCHCDYCGAISEKAIGAPVNDLFELIATGVRYEWTDPINELPWDEGGYVFDFLSSSELLFEIESPLANDALIEEFIASFSDLSWVPKHFFSLRTDEALSAGWRDFSRHVTTRARFLFADAPATEYGDILVTDVLARIGFAVEQASVLQTIPAGTSIYRVRRHSDTVQPSTADELGPPPSERANQNRMSAAGISMFYGAFDRETALAETPAIPDTHPTIGRFTALKPLMVLDLVDIPDPGSYWDENARPLRRELAFLEEFASTLAKPIQRDGREHVEYVPTQILTEYFKYIFRVEQSPIAGIRYRSSKVEGGQCVVLFAGHVPFEERGLFDPYAFQEWLELSESTQA